MLILGFAKKCEDCKFFEPQSPYGRCKYSGRMKFCLDDACIAFVPREKNEMDKG